MDESEGIVKPYYDDGRGIVIYHGDCREVLPTLGPVDLVLTDPPYGMRKAEWDMQIVPVADWLPACRLLGPTVLFCGVQGVFDYPRPDWILSWTRVASAQRNGALGGFNNWEPILAYGLKALCNDTVSVPNIPDGIDGHPTPKPLRLIRLLLSRLSGETVLDPFMGSGTTLVAAKQLGRRAIGIEIEERYCAIAVERLRQEVLDFASAPASQPEQLSLEES